MNSFHTIYLWVKSWVLHKKVFSFPRYFTISVYLLSFFSTIRYYPILLLLYNISPKRIPWQVSKFS